MSAAPIVRRERPPLWALLRTALAVAFACSCGPRVVDLHPVTGDTFRFNPPPAATPPYGPFAANATAEGRFKALVAAWRTRLNAAGSPGGALAVVLDGHLRFAAGVGMREAERDEPITATTTVPHGVDQQDCSLQPPSCG